MGKSTNDLNSIFEHLNLSAIASTAGVLGLFKAFTSFTGAISNFVSNSMNVYSSFETIETGLKTVMQDAVKGKEAFEDLRKFSNETTFGVDELASATTQLMNVGMQFEDVKERLKQIGDIAGGSKEKFADLVSIFAKIESTGKAGSMQIQQLAMRGVPIIQMLKDMGVEGKASAKDIEKAFETLAGEGGQFNGAMENILQTIEGKRGEVTDFFKEFTVSFAEASGMAELYKKSLDIVRDVVIKLADAMKVINENPVYKALFRGALAFAISTIAVGLVSKIIPALVGIASKLKIIAGLGAVISPQVLLIAGIATAIGAVGIALKNHYDKIKEANELALKTEETLIRTSKEYGVNEQSGKGDSLASQTVNNYIKELSKINLEMKKIEKEMSQIEEKGSETYKYYEDELAVLKNQKIQIKEKLSFLAQEEVRIQKLLDLEKERARYNKANKDKFQDAIAEIEEEFSKLQNNKLEQEIQKYESMKTLKYTETGYAPNGASSQVVVTMPNDKLKEIDAILEKLYEQRNKEAKNGTWQGRFEESTGVDVSNLSNGSDAVKKYIKAIDDSNKLQKEISESIYGSFSKEEQLKQEQKKLDKLVEDYTKLVQKGFDATTNVNQSMLENIKAQQKRVKELNDQLQEFDIMLKLNKMKTESANKLKAGDTSGIGGYAGAEFASGAISASGDASNFMQGFATGGPWGGVISAVVGAIFNVAKEFDNFEKVMNPVTEAMKQLKPVIKVIFDLTERFIDGANVFFGIIGDILEFLTPLLEDLFSTLEPLTAILNLIGKLLKIVFSVLKPIIDIIHNLFNFLFGWINNTATEFNDSLRSLSDETKEEADRLKKINEQYKTLTETLKEYEEYYLAKRRELNAKNELSNLTGVNDMILTPHGNFSTHPEDTIMAMKHPEQLMSMGGNNIQVLVKNEAGDVATANATTTTDIFGNPQILISVSKRLAQDVATGSNGWDNALNQRDRRLNGRKITN